VVDFSKSVQIISTLRPLEDIMGLFSVVVKAKARTLKAEARTLKSMANFKAKYNSQFNANIPHAIDMTIAPIS